MSNTMCYLMGLGPTEMIKATNFGIIVSKRSPIPPELSPKEKIVELLNYILH